MPVSSNSQSASKEWGATIPGGYASYDSEQITADGLKILTAAKVSAAGSSETLVILQVDTANIRWKVGADATAALGEQLAAGDSITLELPRVALLALTMYPVSGTPIVNVQYLYR